MIRANLWKIALVTIGLLSCSGVNAQISGSTRQFMYTAARDGMAEVRLGRLAENRSSNPAVVQFAQQMERDHSQANDQLRRLARNRDMTLPTDLNADQRNLWQRLSGLQGRAFDRAYAHAMLDAHRKAVALFAARANTGRNDPVSGWASDTLPTLREHLRMARDLVANVDAIRPHRSHGNGNWNGNRDGNMNRNGYRNP